MNIYTNYNTGEEAWNEHKKCFGFDTAYNSCMRYLESKLVHTISDNELKFCRELYAAMNGWNQNKL